MFVTDLEKYIKERPQLIKMSVDLEISEDCTDFIVAKTKETYSFEDEQEADTMVNDVRQDVGFLGVEKKYKAGKLNKAGDVVRPETWQVVAKIQH